MPVGKCPSCGMTMPHIAGEAVDVKVGQTTYKGVTFRCPRCHTVISAGIDPIAIKSDILDKLK